MLPPFLRLPMLELAANDDEQFQCTHCGLVIESFTEALYHDCRSRFRRWLADWWPT